MDLRAFSRATPIRARRAGSTNAARTICSTMTASTRTSCVDIHVEGAAAQGARASRPQRLSLHDRPHERRGAVGERLRVRSTRATGVDLKTGRLNTSNGKSRNRTRWCATSARRRRARRTGSPSSFSPKTGLLYIPHNNLCMDMEERRGQLYRRHALCRRQRAYVARPRRTSRRVLRLGYPCRARKSGRSRKSFPVWSGALATGGQRRLLRHDGRLVQSARRQDRRASVAVQDRLRHHRPADDL